MKHNQPIVFFVAAVIGVVPVGTLLPKGLHLLVLFITNGIELCVQKCVNSAVQ